MFRVRWKRSSVNDLANLWTCPGQPGEVPVYPGQVSAETDQVGSQCREPADRILGFCPVPSFGFIQEELPRYALDPLDPQGVHTPRSPGD
jgi:hypothetical protein